MSSEPADARDLEEAATQGAPTAPPAAFEACIRAGGVALFPSDTVYGLACDPDNEAAVARLYALKRRPPDKAAALMFFDLPAALARLPELPAHTRAALGRLMPGGVTALLENPHRRWPLACRADPATFGLRVVDVPVLARVSVAVLQSSANLSGGPDARRVEDVPAEIRSKVDLVVDGGELPGVASTVVDLRAYERTGGWKVIREGALGAADLAAALTAASRFEPSNYGRMIRGDVPRYEALQDCLVGASRGRRVHRMLELGTGTGETARRLLAVHPGAAFVGVDASAEMLDAARAVLPEDGVELRVGRFQDPLPEGPFDLVATALAVHHLTGPEKADLFSRVKQVLDRGGRFVLADVVVPVDPAEASVTLTPGFDTPDSTTEQLAWLAQAGFVAHVTWQQRDLAVIVADVPGF